MIRQIVARLARRFPHRNESELTITRREDGQFALTYLDDLGREQEHVFATREEARRHRRLVHESVRRGSAEYDDFQTYGGGTGGGGAL